MPRRYNLRKRDPSVKWIEDDTLKPADEEEESETEEAKQDAEGPLMRASQEWQRKIGGLRVDMMTEQEVQWAMQAPWTGRDAMQMRDLEAMSSNP